jgi:hypothetical protein
LAILRRDNQAEDRDKGSGTWLVTRDQADDHQLGAAAWLDEATVALRLASALPLTPLDALGEGQKSECASGEAGSLKRGNNQPSRPKNPNHTLTTTAPIKMPSVTFSAKVTACRLDGFQRALCNAIAPAQIIQAIRKLMSA